MSSSSSRPPTGPGTRWRVGFFLICCGLPGRVLDGRANPPRRGFESESAATRTFLTAASDQAARANNEC